MAVREWHGLNGTHLVAALSFRSSIRDRRLAEALFGPPQGAMQQSRPFVSVEFRVTSLLTIQKSSTIQVHATLILRRYYSGSGVSNWRPVFRASRPWNHRPSPRRFSQSVPVIGLLSVETRELSATVCFSKHDNPRDPSHIVQDCKIAINLKYPEARSMLTPVIVGTIKSLRTPSDSLYFNPVQVYANFMGNYVYSKLDESKTMCDGGNGEFSQEIGVYKGANVCSVLMKFYELQVLWDADCNSSRCGPFTEMASDADPWLQKLAIDLMDCDDTTGHMNGFLVLSSWRVINTSPVTVDSVLAFEGSWSSSSGQLCLVACHYSGNYSGEDCSIQIHVQFPLTLTLQQRLVLLGHVASLKNSSDPRYFKPFALQASSVIPSIQQVQPLLNLVYNYTRLDQVEECTRGTAGDNKTAQEGKYPGVSNFIDLSFLAQFKNQKQIKRAFVRPLTVGSSFVQAAVQPAELLPLVTSSKSNVSFSISLDGQPDEHSASESWHPEISAEGIYDTNSGKLCLIGCRMVDIPQKGFKDRKDCEILIKIQYPPSDPALSEKHPLSGTILSLRNNTDPLHFEPMEVSTSNLLYSIQARDALWRKDFEIFLSMITLSIMVIVVILQFMYSRRHPEALPYMSLLMLVILTLGHMIPLVLNFEAIFSGNTQKTPLVLSGGWIEVKEVIIRIMTMALFLLQLRLLQLAWTARHSRLTQEGIQIELSERKVLKVCLPLYLLGAILACFLQWLLSYSALEAHFLWKAMQVAWWAFLKGYTGLVVDFFLLPQVVANFLWGVQEKPLSRIFYGGMTGLRSLPHLYDAYRTYKFIPQYSGDYFYATPESDFFSLIWDIFIPCVGLLLALAIFLQQKFGGRCIIPSKWRGNPTYQKISPPTA
ncbi:hypothetical protein O6H91_14G067600 [Diphasiastrum complanatum]|nr:hypothetical protein O6H91_Y282600 [Diphasiastrum complanatum]KAJ7531984.1 hypothetical protein O6H91_14G067600 [Diphasiastrum complanatum]